MEQTIRGTSNGTMTAREMLPAVGAMVDVKFEDVWIVAHITDVKHVWGKPRFQIEPMAGSGSQWVEFARLRQIMPSSSKVVSL